MSEGRGRAREDPADRQSLSYVVGSRSLEEGSCSGRKGARWRSCCCCFHCYCCCFYYFHCCFHCCFHDCCCGGTEAGPYSPTHRPADEGLLGSTESLRQCLGLCGEPASQTSLGTAGLRRSLPPRGSSSRALAGWTATALEIGLHAALWSWK